MNEELARGTDKTSKKLSTVKQELDLLNMILTYKCEKEDMAEDRAVASSLGAEADAVDVVAPAVKKRKGKIGALSGDIDV